MCVASQCSTSALVISRRRLVEAEPHQRHVALLRHERGELRLQHVAELVGEEARRMEPARDAGLDARSSAAGTSSGVHGGDDVDAAR